MVEVGFAALDYEDRPNSYRPKFSQRPIQLENMASTRIAALSTAFAAGFAASHYSILTSWKIEAQRRDLDDERDFPGLPPTPTEPPYSDHARRILAYANPGPVADKLLRGGFLVAYDRRTRLPYYSAQLLPQPPPAEKIDRSKINFAEDGDIPPRFRSKVADYKGTGLDRGHLAPFADMPSVEAQKDSFLLSNIAPQDRGLNRGFWGDLEAWCRWLPGKGVDEVAVFTGPMFLSKKAEDGKSYVRYEVLGDPPNTAVPWVD